jgi:hypothetical protein
MADDLDDDEPLYVAPAEEPAELVAGAAPARGALRAKAANTAQKARPWLEQAWLNVRVWLPALRPPAMKSRLVKYRAREQRSGMTWQIGLPQQCWQCGAVEGLTSKKFDNQVRTFKDPTNVLGLSLGFAAMLLVLWILSGWGWCWKGALLLSVGGGAWLWIKSWKERVRLTAWSCPAHLDELTAPRLVCHDDDVYFYAPSESLAETARAELAAARKKQGKYREAMEAEPAGDAPAGRPTDESPPAGRRKPRELADPPVRVLPVRSELPPLKLAGEEDSETA